MNWKAITYCVVQGVLAVLLIWLCLHFVGCKTQVPLTNTIEKERIVTEVVRDTTIITQADSAAIHALFECDSTNKVVLCQLETLQGERIQPTVVIKHTDAGTEVQFDCKEDSLRYEIALRDKIIEERTTQTEQVAVKYVPDYYKRVSTGFWILLAILVLIVGWKVAKAYFKIQTGGLGSILNKFL